jgi:hypothetical protein
MEVEIVKMNETVINLNTASQIKIYNPEGMDFKKQLRIKCLESTEEYTRIDFVIRSSMIWDNGGWIQMERNAYIQPKGSNQKYRLIKAIGIPIAPTKHFFKRQGEYHTYTLIFPALPKNTDCIDIIEKLETGTFFNFYNIDYSNWITVPNAADITRKDN